MIGEFTPKRNKRKSPHNGGVKIKIREGVSGKEPRGLAGGIRVQPFPGFGQVQIYSRRLELRMCQRLLHVDNIRTVIEHH